MKFFHNQHNANLPYTLPKMEPIVNFVIRDEQDPDRVEYKVSYAPPKLFVKITNSIFNFQLKPRQIEFYCNLCYLVKAYPYSELPYPIIMLLILKHTGINFSKNTITLYINELIELGLIAKVGKYYHIYGDKSNQDNNTNTRLELELELDIELEIKKKESNSSSISITKTKTKTNSSSNSKIKGNKYYEPKDNYKPFFITIYNKDTKPGSMAVELYLASKPYNFHRPSLVCKELNISRATYYKYLKDLVTKGIVTKHLIKYPSYNINHYTHDYRQVLWNDYINIQDLNYMDKGFTYQDKNIARRLKREQEGYKTPHSRIWYSSPMKRIMKQYNINYLQDFDNYDPEDAYLIVQELEQQYKANPNNLRAGLIVDAIRNSYNWTKIVDRRHSKFKREQKREKEKFGNSRYMEECFGI